MSQRRADLDRRTMSRSQRAIVVVVCEGQTEYAYLDALRLELPRGAIVLKVFPTKKTTPHHLVATAQQKRLEVFRGEKPKPGDAVWVVCDGDEHRGSDTERAQWHVAMATAAEQGIEVAWSNPNFELWLLLRFVNQTAQLSKEEAGRKLKRYLPNYDKGDNTVVRELGKADTDLTSGPIQTALRHAGRPSPKSDGDLPNPSTRFGCLIQFLLSKR
jgi:hypothetical protein